MAAKFYFNKDSAVGGDGTTNATTGANRAFNSLSLAEAGAQSSQSDLSISGKLTLSGAGNTTEDTTQVTIAGFTNASATNYIEVITEGTGVGDGTAGSGYVLTRSSGHAITVQVPYTRIGIAGGGLEIKSTSTGSSDEGIRFDLQGGNSLLDCYVVGNLIHSTTSTSSKDGIYINPNSSSGRVITLYAYANIIYGWNRCGIHNQMYQGTNTSTLNAEHNTLYGNGTGDVGQYEQGSNVCVANSYNNLCASSVSFVQTGGSSTPAWNGSNNVTLDANYNLGSMTGGTQATSGVAVVTKASGSWVLFTNVTSGSEDFTLLEETAYNIPVDYGTDRTSTVPNDFLGNAYATTSDCGALEYTSSVTAGITGTMTATVDEDDITTGGKTIIITLTGDTFKAAGTGPIGSTADTQALIDGFDAASSPTNGWNNEVRDKALTSEVVRTSDTVATWTVAAQSGYDITAQEVITGTIPTAVLVTGAGAITATPTFTIDAAVSGRIMSSLTSHGGLAGFGGLAGQGGGLAG